MRPGGSSSLSSGRRLSRGDGIHPSLHGNWEGNFITIRAACLLLEDGMKRGHGSKLGRKMEAAVAALLTQRTLEEAARLAGISVSTLLRWQKEPEFSAAYRESRRAVVWQSSARLQQASSAAVSVLLKLMVDPQTPPACRLRAA